eukprot:COSAG02_NODE_3062_length_7447_cov_14.342678_9_plen_142_part_00
MCGSRVPLLSGRYPLHHGINDWIPPSSSYGMPLNETTIADHFKSAGFKTHAIGNPRCFSLLSQLPMIGCWCGEQASGMLVFTQTNLHPRSGALTVSAHMKIACSSTRSSNSINSATLHSHLAVFGICVFVGFYGFYTGGED